MGSHKELMYLQQSLMVRNGTTKSDDDDENRDIVWIVHAAQSNDGNTLDGIEAGGKRLAQEVNDLLDHVVRQVSVQRSSTDDDDNNDDKPDLPSITLSMISFSLGGLYSRYAVSKIDWEISSQSRNGNSNNGKDVSIHPHLFITLASPHLGINKYQYFSTLPDIFKKFGAKSMKETGQDLYLNTPLLQSMCFDPIFTTPLSRFTKRMAYGNAFDIDFPVPTATAVFLGHDDGGGGDGGDDDDDHLTHQLLPCTANSTIKRKNATSQQEDDTKSDNKHRAEFSTIRFQTEARTRNENENDDDAATTETPIESRMAKALDSLGWTKILIDLRHELPQIGFQKRTSSMNLTKWFLEEQEQCKNKYSSNDLIRAFTASSRKQQRKSSITVPIAHSWLVASSKNPFYQWFYQRGRGIADELANEIVHEVLHSQ